MLQLWLAADGRRMTDDTLLLGREDDVEYKWRRSYFNGEDSLASNKVGAFLL